MKIYDIFDEDLYVQMLVEGYVRAMPHPTLDLDILNYTEKAQFQKKWNEVTLNCRGLIMDQKGEVVARPFPKFFNLGEGPILFDMNAPVEVTDKMDGSLGILYAPVAYSSIPPHGFEYKIATRGSFISDQAAHATSVWHERYRNTAVPQDWTFLFEIIYPSNRIVLNYNGMDDLVLLGAVNKVFGYILGPLEAQALLNWTGPTAEVFKYKTMQDAFNAPPRENAEGYVIRSGSKMVKMKQTDYMELHRLISNLSEKSVWEGMRRGQSAAEICESLPDEFHGFVIDTWAKLFGQFHELNRYIMDEFGLVMLRLGENPSRKDFAFATAMSQYRKYMFLLLDNKSINDLIWEDIKPRSNTREDV